MVSRGTYQVTEIPPDTPLDESVRIYFAHVDPYDPPKNHRMWLHDVIHLALAIPPGGTKPEVSAAIYQSVLLRDLTCSARITQIHDIGRLPTLREVKEKIIPGILNYVSYKVGLVPGTLPSDEEIAEYYGRACVLGKVIENHFGCRLAEIPESTLHRTTLGTMRDLVAQANAIYDRQQSRTAKSGVMLE